MLQLDGLLRGEQSVSLLIMNIRTNLSAKLLQLKQGLNMWFIPLLGVLVFSILILLMVLVVNYPDSAEHLAEISGTLAPWISIVLLSLVFHKGVKQIIASLAGVLDRRMSIGPTGVQFAGQRQNPQLTDEQVQQLQNDIQSLTEEKVRETAWAWYFFVRCILDTIYGTQVKLLISLQDGGPKSSDELFPFYREFQQRAPTDAAYQFQGYVGYLVSNTLILHDTSTDKYALTESGNYFLNHLSQIGISWSTFRG